MSKPHKHADVIKAWADGKAVQVAFYPEPTHDDPLAQREPNWRDVTSLVPTFSSDMLYRIKPEPLEWQAEREAFARGEKIEWRRVGSVEWHPCPRPVWGSSGQCGGKGDEYRIAPKKWAKEREAFARGERVQFCNIGSTDWRDLDPGHAVDWDCWPGEFRIPHKWQKEIDAWERGEDVEVRDDNGIDGPACAAAGLVGKSWAKIDRRIKPVPAWVTRKGREYRIKPKTETHRIRVALMQHTSSSTPFTRTVVAYGEATTVERMAAFVRWLCDWQEVEVDASPKCEQGSWKDLPGGGSDGGVAAVKQALEDCAKFAVGAYQFGFDVARPGGDKSVIFGFGIDENGVLVARHVKLR